MNISKGRALLDEFLKAPEEERVEKFKKLSLEDREALERLLKKTEETLQKQLSIVEARGEQLNNFLTIVASYVKPKGKA